MCSERPRRIKVLPWGLSETAAGRVQVTRQTLAELPRNQRSRGFAQVALDFEHNTVPGSPEYERTQEPRPVAAFGSPLVIEGEGLYLDDLRWTPTGIQVAHNFPDLSAAPQLLPDGTVVFIHSAALTRAGAVPNMHLPLDSAASHLKGFARTAAIFQAQIEKLQRPAPSVTRLSVAAPDLSGLRGIARTAAAWQQEWDSFFQ